MSNQRQYQVHVIRDGFVIDTHTAPAALAQQYANVMRLLYPNDQIRCDRVPEMQTPAAAIARPRNDPGAIVAPDGRS
ncbi:hypothetical protein EV644_107286 [Kribbella orskensis]|uniref:Lsr2 protein n=1 Tax=Kribbella orskensis TaxID=2512216 RepID=A0ABY2BJ61_9ACTN|nr:hypothetical protein EV642_107286 [Kribbella sp. VKM Ac-2500]TCO21961.1 hypothetical protein EV644_107286 [Kribbella orskensis]